MYKKRMRSKKGRLLLCHCILYILYHCKKIKNKGCVHKWFSIISWIVVTSYFSYYSVKLNSILTLSKFLSAICCVAALLPNTSSSFSFSSFEVLFRGFNTQSKYFCVSVFKTHSRKIKKIKFVKIFLCFGLCKTRKLSSFRFSKY